MASKDIRYKDVTVKPKSELHDLLTRGDLKGAEKSYKATEERYRILMGSPKKGAPE